MGHPQLNPPTPCDTSAAIAASIGLCSTRCAMIWVLSVRSYGAAEGTAAGGWNKNYRKDVALTTISLEFFNQ